MAKLASDPENEHAAALSRITSLARGQLPPRGPSAEEAFRRYLHDVGRKRDQRSALVRRAVFIPALGALLVGLGIAGWKALQPPALTYAVHGAAAGEGGYVRTTEASATVRFSDGTQVDVDKGSLTRVASTRPDGARVILDSGRAHVKVVPRKGGSWVFDAGPCRVQVTGTAFDMRWSPFDQVLEVVLHTGSVIVSGPPTPRGITVPAGQRLVMDVRGGSARLERLAPAPAAAPAAPEFEPPPAPVEAAGPPEAPVVEELPVERPTPARASRRAEVSWPAMVLAGEFTAVLRDASRRGFDDVLRRAPAADLMALADAARFGGALSLARQSLLAVRKRFGGSSSAHRAAFLLGRMAEDNQNDLDEALKWYGVYLSAAPAGGYQSEALGRKMTATLRLRGAAQARPVAEEYLRQFPNGPYADPARAIVGGR